MQTYQPHLKIFMYSQQAQKHAPLVALKDKIKNITEQVALYLE